MKQLKDSFSKMNQKYVKAVPLSEEEMKRTYGGKGFWDGGDIRPFYGLPPINVKYGVPPIVIDPPIMAYYGLPPITPNTELE